MKCVSGILGFCDPTSLVPAVDLQTGVPDQLVAGSYVRMYTCHDKAAPGLKSVQVWRQRSDCVLGCPPWLQYNSQCDPACNVKACNFDEGSCSTQAPSHNSGTTPSPTLPHTVPPTFSCPAL